MIATMFGLLTGIDWIDSQMKFIKGFYNTSCARDSIRRGFRLKNTDSVCAGFRSISRLRHKEPIETRDGLAHERSESSEIVLLLK